MPGLSVAHWQRPTSFEASMYEPVLCLILQGRKEVTIGDERHAMSAGECMVVSHDLPVLGRVTKAPYLVALLAIDVPLLRSLYDEVSQASCEVAEARAIAVEKAEPQLLDAMERYLAAASCPVDTRVLGPMLAREVHYRLLRSALGGMLRRLLRPDSNESAIARAIAQIRRDFRAPIEVSALARSVGMSVSAFHKHFKEVTASSPLQFQKDLRMLAAKRLLVTGAASVSTAAYEVGYQSPNQFSREYARKFGAPPSRDLSAVQRR
jgi:AraC-like DNA-binding protein